MTVMVEEGNYTFFCSEGKQHSLRERGREKVRREMGARECEAKGDHQKAVERGRRKVLDEG